MRSWVEDAAAKSSGGGVYALVCVCARACVGVFGGVTVLHLQHWKNPLSNSLNSKTPGPERSPERNRRGLGLFSSVNSGSYPLLSTEQINPGDREQGRRACSPLLSQSPPSIRTAAPESHTPGYCPLNPASPSQVPSE